MNAVAEHLGVSVAGLYHHVHGREDLLRLAAEHSMSEIHIPEDHGQHWAEWLREWARYSRAAMLAQPELLAQLMNGALPLHRIVESVDKVLSLLTRQGFDPAGAYHAWAAVSHCTVGAIVEQLRERSATKEGRPTIAEFHRLLAQRAPDDLPGLRALLRAVPERDPEADFEDQITTVLVGVAVQRGLSYDDIVGARPRPSSPRARRGGGRLRKTR
jgi:AcrR family transcriptional regulator